MPDNVNPQAIKFANEKARIFADCLLCAIQTAENFVSEYDASTLDTIFPNNADLILDGSESDGRIRIANNTIRALRTAAVDLATWGNVGTPTRENRLRTIAVNGQSRY